MTAFAGQLVQRWREEAALFRRRGAGAHAKLLESCASDLEQRGREHELEGLTLEQAAAESGYTYSAVEKMVRRGELLNVGKKGAPRVRRGDLPRKPRHQRGPGDSGGGIAALTLASRQSA